MVTKQEIERMFREMGLATEADRARFLQFARGATEPDADKEQIFVRATTTTSIDEEVDDGELE